MALPAMALCAPAATIPATYMAPFLFVVNFVDTVSYTKVRNEDEIKRHLLQITGI